jgi:hypothetical protein
MEFVIPPPSSQDPRRHIRFRDIAVDWMRGTPTFASVSRRLLTDLMDVADHHDVRASPQSNRFLVPGIALLVVLDGVIVVERLVAAPVPGQPTGAPEPPPFVSHLEPPDEPSETEPVLRPGVYLGNDPRWGGVSLLRIRTPKNYASYVIVVSRKKMIRWLRGSPALLHGVGFPKGYEALVTADELFPGPGQDRKGPGPGQDPGPRPGPGPRSGPRSGPGPDDIERMLRRGR